MIRRSLILSITLLVIIGWFACDDKDETPLQPTVVKEWTIPIHARNENPAPPGRTESGTAELTLYSDNSFTYHVMLSNLTAGDAITAGHLHFGDPVTNGPVILDLAPVFNGLMSTGEVQVNRATLVDSIINGSVYINIHSTQFPAGLLRGQLDKTLDLVMDVALSGESESPPVSTTATGLALLRLTTDKVLYYRVNVSNLEAGDALTAAHIHSGAAGTNGGVLIGLASSPADFGIPKMVALTDAAFNSLKNDPLYVNVHSTNYGDGIIRGQIR